MLAQDHQKPLNNKGTPFFSMFSFNKETPKEKGNKATTGVASGSIRAEVCALRV